MLCPYCQNINFKGFICSPCKGGYPSLRRHKCHTSPLHLKCHSRGSGGPSGVPGLPCALQKAPAMALVNRSKRRHMTLLIDTTRASCTCDAARGHSSSSTSRHDTALRWLCGVVPNSLGSLYVLGVDRSRLSRSALPSRAASKGLPDLAVPEGDVTVLSAPLLSCSRNRALSYKPLHTWTLLKTLGILPTVSLVRCGRVGKSRISS